MIGLWYSGYLIRKPDFWGPRKVKNVNALQGYEEGEYKGPEDHEGKSPIESREQTEMWREFSHQLCHLATDLLSLGQPDL